VKAGYKKASSYKNKTRNRVI